MSVPEDSLLGGQAANWFSAGTAATAQAAAAAARAHRLAGAQPVDYRSLARWVEQLLPFAALMALVFVYHHCSSIFLYAFLTVSIASANSVLRRLVSCGRCDAAEVAAVILFAAANAAATLYLSGSQQARALLLLPPPLPPSFLGAAFSVAVTDALVRCCGIIPKLLLFASATISTRREQQRQQQRRSSSGGGGAPAAATPTRGASADGAPAAATHTAPGRSSLEVGRRAAGGGPAVQWAACPVGCSGAAGAGCGGCAAGGSSPGGSGGLSSLDAAAVRRTRSSPASATCEIEAAAAAAAAITGWPPAVAEAVSAAPLPSVRRTLSSGAALGWSSPGPAPSPPVVARRRARLLALHDTVHAAYRFALPIPVWHAYLSSSIPNAPLAGLLAAAYLLFKAHGLLRRGRLLLLATRLVLRTGALYGRYLTKGEEAALDDPTCPICQEGCSAPIRLDCTHVFCEPCLAEWLEREPSCPMCRSMVKPRGLSLGGDGATPLLPQLF